ncbi:hypothetical protein D8B26_008387 [Coccidioides posadasii str. Silveira]|uniref:Uncharacterized protein n=2 Tax=Coccidioides posadasii TaxID=199306 RepID=A0A0J6FT51_COCPO|nr:hypothetical protein CPC735_019580 [Coccidioides posadasii C735 delta SOWgp]EER25351.1 hypothetical protein CPC735_019580 [Coccidioides posadasii C735 delta SOWgp]KMM72269.1 hypothetical protein CPAG_08566 [Coccidioides posadasii RMSCC 3488]QVM13756.1 hypothetical protein D8B26_008387 [Coccidioides posadasii str. Silveira]|eukprot:XP_003067496.1 hypothetical protein CPC735_019580 [Coccidioides posadasii C735 delta SOWgp]
MARAFSSTARTLVRWLGYDKELLTPEFRQAVDHYAANGAVKKVGEIESIEILHRNDSSSPIHRSHYNPKDKELIISARVKPTNGPARTHHIYANGTGTIRVGDKREYSTSATQGGPVDMAAEEGPRE